jgi:hypothetical protein
VSGRYVVDGSTCKDRMKSVFDSDPKIGRFPPFVVFDIMKQQFVPPEYETREEAQQSCDALNSLDPAKEIDATRPKFKPVVVPVQPDRTAETLISREEHMRNVLRALELDTEVQVLLTCGSGYRGMVAESSADNVLCLCTERSGRYEYVEIHESQIAAVVVHKI